jgi:hypothetical protein
MSIVTINGVEYQPVQKSSDVRIVVLQRGWVFIGRYVKAAEDEHRLDNAKCIRVWGTTKGLAELVNGPTSSTKLDESGVVRFHPLTVVTSIDAKEDKWEKYL